MQQAAISKTNRMVGMAILIAIIVLLQILGSFIKFGAFSVSLVLVPIVIGAAMYGSAAGALFGAAFGVVVLMNCVNGVDPGGNMLWAVNPAATAILCLLKGAMAGFAAGCAYSAVSKRRPYLGVIYAAIACPVVNTGIFIAAMFFLYRDTLILWAGGTSIVYFAFVGLAGFNFLFELAINAILAPGIVRIINAVKKSGL